VFLASVFACDAGGGDREQKVETTTLSKFIIHTLFSSACSQCNQSLIIFITYIMAIYINMCACVLIKNNYSFQLVCLTGLRSVQHSWTAFDSYIQLFDSVV